MDYKEGFEKVKENLQKFLEKNCYIDYIINGFQCGNSWGDGVKAGIKQAIYQLDKLESEITKTQQECDHCPDCGLKLR